MISNLLDLTTFFLSVGGFIYAFKLQRMVRARKLNLLTLALLYTSILRLLVVLSNFGMVKLDYVVLTTAFFGFYVLIFLAVVSLYFSLKQFLEGNKS